MARDWCTPFEAKNNQSFRFSRANTCHMNEKTPPAAQKIASGDEAKTSNLQDLGGRSGAQGRSRTADTAIFSRMLYQLSYLGI
jgi:hypothetical protein